MLKLKALYISSYVTFVVLVSGYALWGMTKGPVLPWLAALATTLPAALLFARAYRGLFPKNPVLRSENVKWRTFQSGFQLPILIG